MGTIKSARPIRKDKVTETGDKKPTKNQGGTCGETSAKQWTRREVTQAQQKELNKKNEWMKTTKKPSSRGASARGDGAWTWETANENPKRKWRDGQTRSYRKSQQNWVRRAANAANPYYQMVMWLVAQPLYTQRETLRIISCWHGDYVLLVHTLLFIRFIFLLSKREICTEGYFASGLCTDLHLWRKRKWRNQEPFKVF